MEKQIAAALTPQVMQRAFELWSIPAASLSLIRDYENFVYNVVIDRRPAILRVTYAGHRDLDALVAEIDFIHALGRNRIPICQPIASVQGAWVERLSEHFNACCFVFASGRKVSWKDPLVWHERTFVAWGRMLGRLHCVSERSPQSSGPRRHRWDQDDINTGHYLPASDSDIAQRQSTLIEKLRRKPTDPHHFGLIHADLHQGNFFSSEQGELAIFDFDDSCYHWFNFDLSIVFYHLPAGEAESPPLPSRPQIIKHVLDGYREIRPLPDGFLDDIHSFLLLRDMQMYQMLFKKNAAEDRQPWWHAQATRISQRIRDGQPIFEVAL
jgi:Ser/Thr protein kinase RdoA (MazF antagonist)